MIRVGSVYSGIAGLELGLLAARALGNAVVPQCSLVVGRALLGVMGL